jgi:transposase
MQLTTIGLDIAKNVFQVHGVDRQDKAGLRKRLSWGSVLAFFANLPPGLNRAGGLWRRALLGAEAARARHERAAYAAAVMVQELRARSHDRALVRGSHRGQRLKPHPQAARMAAAKTPCQNANKALAMREASMDGPSSRGHPSPRS